jgi:DNA-binding NarL/FixJ family response regulator
MHSQASPTIRVAIIEDKRDVPDVALVDIGPPGMNGIEGIRLLKERHPDMPLLMLTRWTVARRCRPRWRAR